MSTLTNALPLLGAIALGSTAASALTYKLYSKRVLLASTTQSTEPLTIEYPPLLPASSSDSAQKDNGDATAKGTKKDTSCRKLAVIIGWGGAQMKHLRRLQDAYAAKGFATVVVLPSMLIYFENGGCLGASAELLLLLRQYLLDLKESTAANDDSNPPPRILFHLHSNTGAFYYYTVMRVMRYSLFADVAKANFGTVYDSTPGHPSLFKLRPPEAFKGELAAFLEAEEKAGRFAESPILLRKSVAGALKGAAADATAASVESDVKGNMTPDPIFSLATPSLLKSPLPLSGSWRSVGFANGDKMNPFLWAFYSYIMAFVVTPLILRRNQYVHWFWWPVSFMVGLKEYAHTSIAKTFGGNRVPAPSSLSAPSAIDVSEDVHLTRYGALLTPHAIPSMERLARLLSDPTNTADGYAGNYAGAFRHLNAVVSLDRLVNRDIEAPTNAPELFLYSGGDKMVIEKDIHKYLFARLGSEYLNKTPAVFVHRFGKSPHVAHFLKHPEAYNACLDNFIAFALRAKELQLAAGRSVLPVLRVPGATSTGPLPKL